MYSKILLTNCVDNVLTWLPVSRGSLQVITERQKREEDKKKRKELKKTGSGKNSRKDK